MQVSVGVPPAGVVWVQRAGVERRVAIQFAPRQGLSVGGEEVPSTRKCFDGSWVIPVQDANAGRELGIVPLSSFLVDLNRLKVVKNMLS